MDYYYNNESTIIFPPNTLLDDYTISLFRELKMNEKEKIERIREEKENKAYQYNFINNNGVAINLSGKYEDIAIVKYVLEKSNVPKITKEQGRKLLEGDIHIEESIEKEQKKVDKLKVKKVDASHAHITFGGKTYSGSGSLIIFLDSDEFYVPLFLSNDGNEIYNDLGGRINYEDSYSDDIETILFKNNKREVYEESCKLFEVESEKKPFIDINSKRNDTLYRSYIHMIDLDGYENLRNSYNNNFIEIMKGKDIPHSYRETKDLEFFKLETLVSYVKDNNVLNISEAILQTNTGKQVRVGGRVLNVIASFARENVKPDSKEVVLNKNGPFFQIKI